jgi:hypothetical protein
VCVVFALSTQRLSRELDAANKQLAAARKELEAETIRRVDLENRNKSLQEQITFQAQLHRKVGTFVKPNFRRAVNKVESDDVFTAA